MNGNDEASFKTLKRVTTQDHLRNLFPEDVSKPEELTKARLPIMRQDVMMSLGKVWPMPRARSIGYADFIHVRTTQQRVVLPFLCSGLHHWQGNHSGSR